MGENFTITLGQDKVFEELDNLFPNGGWDVHHHIFERMCDLPQTSSKLTYCSI
jgi:pyruvate dehydrogenase complex dehydrogenase (E1) component